MIRLYRHKVAIICIAACWFMGCLNAKAEVNIETEVSIETGLDEKYIDYIYDLALNNKVYADKYYNYNKDLVYRQYGPILNIGKTKYQRYDNIRTIGIDRPSEYFLPDSVYSVAYDIKTLMQYNYYKDRGGYQRFFDSFNEDIKQSIVFCEAVLEYTGEDRTAVNKFARAYELYAANSIPTIEQSLEANCIQDETRIGYIKKIFELDEDLAKQEDIEDKKEIYEMPYLIGYTSRENLLESAFSLVGKVRYMWAGGHAKTSNIKGINPVWRLWEQLYSGDEEGSNYCIKPSGAWCPIHGFSEDERCIGYNVLNDYNKYLELRAMTFGDRLLSDKYKGMLDYVDSEDCTAHRLDGLDCSGYVSWIFNQISNKHNIDSTAMYFTRQSGIKSLEFGSEMLPGDIFAWTSHIVVIVGKVADNSKVYVTVEQTPNVLKFGTVFYAGYKQSDLDYAMQIAREANELMGNTTEEPHSYCMNNVGYYSIELNDEREILGNLHSIETKEVGEQTVVVANAQYIDIGRFGDKFIDEEYILRDTGKSLKDLNALDIIQYIITKLPVQYISGYATYNGTLLDKNSVATDVGTTVIREIR